MLFRDLRADEIEVRVAMIKEPQGDKKGGVQLLLYKDARCDMNILDETVGVMNWKKSYQMIDGDLFCTISLWDEEKQQWIDKQDVGVESMTEKEKGRASDAQKRAAFAIGIGRKLYSAPRFIWVNGDKCDIRMVNGKPRCYDNFHVWKIEYDEKRIVKLAIYRERDNEIVYKFGM